MRDEEEEDDDMHQFEPDGDLEETQRPGRESNASRVDLVRGANDSVTSDRQLQVSSRPSTAALIRDLLNRFSPTPTRPGR